MAYMRYIFYYSRQYQISIVYNITYSNNEMKKKYKLAQMKTS